jgi:hypothetical protein
MACSTIVKPDFFLIIRNLIVNISEVEKESGNFLKLSAKADLVQHAVLPIRVSKIHHAYNPTQAMWQVD